MAVQIQLRRGSAAYWTAANPILLQGEIGIELDTNKFKIGNGIDTWNNLGYGNNLSGIGDIPGIDSTSTLNPPNGALLIYNTVTNKWVAELPNIFDVDNIRLDGNTIVTTNVDGDLILDANGTGKISFYNTYTFPRTAGTVGQALVYDGSGALTWAEIASANTASNMAGGDAGQILIQSAPGITTFIPAGTEGQLLQAGSNTATFVSTTTIYVNRAVTADAWTTARTITLTGDIGGSISFDGSSDFTLTATLQASSITLGTDTTGDYVATGATSGFGLSGSTTGENQTFTVTSNATSTNTPSTIVFRNESGNFSAGTITANLSGTATTATNADRWTTARTVTLAGDLSGNVVVDGSQNVILTATIQANSIALGTDTTGIYIAQGATSGFGISGTANTEGSTFTIASNATSTNTPSTIVFRNASGNFSAGTITANLSGTATTATNADRWTTARTITLSGDLGGSAVVDGSQNVTLTATIQANSIALGTDTTGDYVATGTTIGFGLSGSTTGENQTFTVTSNATSTNTPSTIVFRNASGNFSAGTITATTFSGTLGTGGSQSINTNALSLSNYADNTGILYFSNGAGLIASNSANFAWDNTAGTLRIKTSTSATSTTTGALVVTGGVAIGRDLFVNQNVDILGTDASTTTVANNALYVAGGVGIEKSLYVKGPAVFQNDVVFSGTTTFVFSTQTIYTDNILNLHTPSGGVTGAWTVNDGKDIGFVFHNYIDGADNDSFLGWANDTGYLEWYSKGLESTTGTFTGTVYGTIKTGGIILVNNTTSDSTTTGALTVAGGVGVGGNLYIDGIVRIQNTSANTTSDTGALVVAGGAGFGGNIHVQGYGHFGLEPTVLLANPLAVFTSNVNDYTQIQIQNKSAGPSASSDIVATADDGTDTSNYIDLGINSSQFSSGAWTVSGPRDGYLYVANNSLTLGTDSPGTTVKVHVGGTLESDIVAIFREPAISTTSSDTGAVTINGGFGVNGDIHIRDTLHVGPDPNFALQNTLIIGTGNIDGYVQASIQNRSSGFNASTDYVATADDGNDTTNYIDLGINGSGYSDVDWSISGAKDGYLYVSGNSLTLGTDSTGTTVKVHVGGTLIENIVATFNEANTVAISTSTGALIVNGGVGISGSLYVGGTVYSNGVALQNFNTSTLVTTATSAAIAYSVANTGSLYVGRAVLADSFANTSSLYVGRAVLADSFANTGSLYVGRAVVADSATTATLAAIAYSVANTGSLYVGRAVLADSATTATSAATAFSVANTGSLYVGRAVLADSATTATSAGIAYSIANTGSLYVGRAVLADSATTATSAGIAYSIANTGSLYVSRAVLADSATTATSAAIAYSVANTSSLYVGRVVLADSATTATSAAIAYSVANTSSLYVGRATLADSATTATSAATAFSIANTGSLYVGRATLADSATTATSAGTSYATIGVHTAGTGLTGSTFDGSSAVTWTLNTATLMAAAVSATTATSAGTSYATIGVHTAGTGLTGSTFDGSSAVTWTLNTATLMAIAVTATSAAIAYSVANTGSLYVGRAVVAESATTATNIASGAIGSIPYQSGAGTTAFIDIGTAGFVLQSNGTTATWVSTSSLGISGGGGGSSGVSSIAAGTDTAISTATGSVTIWNISTLQSITSRSATTNQAISITSSTIATSTTTGALVVSGGVGIGSNLYVQNSATIASGLISTPGTELTLQQTGDTFGTTALRLQNRNGQNGPLFDASSSTVALVDFGFKTSAGQRVIRFETRNTFPTKFITAGDGAEFQIGVATNPTFVVGSTGVLVYRTTESSSTSTGALLVYGGAGISGNTHIGGNIVIRNTAIVSDASTTSVLTTAVTLDSFPAATYRSSQYVISVSNAGLGEYQTSNVLVVHNGTTAFAQATSVFSGSKVIMNFNATLSGGNVLLQGTGSGTGANPNIVKIQKTYITI